jgi:hypothetical protein
MADNSKPALRGFYCDEELWAETKDLSTALHEGNVSQYMRNALRTTNALRKALGPRFELEVARLLADAEKREGVAA